MPDQTSSRIIFLAAIVLYTTAAAVMDYRFRKIPNRLTVPMCLAGFAFQSFFFGWTGLQTAALGFLTGFGILFMLWMIGSAGGGDVKLLGGLSVWLGAPLTLKVLFCSLVFVFVATAAMLLNSLFSKGLSRTKSRFVKAAAGPGGEQGGESAERRAQRRVMAFAMPVALATWCVLGLYHHQLELFRNHW